MKMHTDKLWPMIERDYRMGKQFQWAREVLANALEAHATRIEFGVEWQGVQAHGVYRRTIADNGDGMTPEELKEFFSTYGGGGKAIGDEHQNFGIGAKTSLMPWNKTGMVVLSWKNSEGSMIHARYNSEIEDYELRDIKTFYDDGTSEIDAVAPLDEEAHDCDEILGIDFATIKPDFIKDHGTMIVLFGDDLHQDSITGDPRFGGDEGESKIHNLARYLNQRLWTVPENDKISVLQFHTQDKRNWPKSRSEKGIFDRTIFGAKRFYANEGMKDEKLPAGFHIDHGTMIMDDGVTELEWFLWSSHPDIKGETAPARSSYAPRRASISVLYKNELYNIKTHHNSFNQFGVPVDTVRRGLWIVIKPPEHDKDLRTGVYPRADRSTLVWHGGNELPSGKWADHFRMNMPDEIRDALRKARGCEGGTIEDQAWRDALSMYAKAWKVTKIIPNLRGRNIGSKIESSPAAVYETDLNYDFEPQVRDRPGIWPLRKRKHKRTTIYEGHDQAASRRMTEGVFPYFQPQREPFEDGFIAQYTPPDVDHKGGIVTIYVEHQMFLGLIEFHKNQFPDRDPESVRDLVETFYGQALVARIAHTEQMHGIMKKNSIDEMRSPAALSLALFGIMPEDAFITQQIKKNALPIRAVPIKLTA